MSEQRASLKSLSVEVCPECGASLFIRDQESGEVACTNCGFVVETRLADRGPEWWQYACTPDPHQPLRMGDFI